MRKLLEVFEIDVCQSNQLYLSSEEVCAHFYQPCTFTVQQCIWALEKHLHAPHECMMSTFLTFRLFLTILSSETVLGGQLKWGTTPPKFRHEAYIWMHVHRCVCIWSMLNVFIYLVTVMFLRCYSEEIKVREKRYMLAYLKLLKLLCIHLEALGDNFKSPQARMFSSE